MTELEKRLKDAGLEVECFYKKAEPATLEDLKKYCREAFSIPKELKIVILNKTKG